MKLKTLTIAALLGMAATTGQAAPVQLTTNGHWYELISTPATWQDAFDAAKLMSHLGMPGYLATITSAEENTFVATLAGAEAWLGGSDAATEGTWVWMNGPEAGKEFTFTSWAPGEPNDTSPGEDYLHTNHAGQFGKWNDYGAPSSPNLTYKYVVEYGAPEPTTLSLMALALAGLAAARRRKQ